MDPDALRIEKIRMAVALAEGRAQSSGRMYVAFGSVALAAGVSAVAAGLAGQIAAEGAFVLAIVAFSAMRDGAPCAPTDARRREGVCKCIRAHRQVDAPGR